MPLIESLLGIQTVGSAGTSPSSHCVSAATTASMALSATSTVVPAGAHANASMLCNLLPSLGQSKGMSLSAGIYVGEGLLAEKITQWEFVEMAELLQEFWSSLASKEPGTNLAPRQSASRHKRAVTDIATWIQCVATYTSVMSTPHPQAVPELLAYLIFILRASQDFGSVVWVTYDAVFRRQAFISGNRQWSKVNPSLYSICFSGAARTGVRCELCLSLSSDS